MVDISTKTWRKNGVEVIVFKDKKWLNEKLIETQLCHANLPSITSEYSSKLRKQNHELQNCGNYLPCRRFLEEIFAKQIIMDCRTTLVVDFKTRLGFKQHHPVIRQEQCQIL